MKKKKKCFETKYGIILKWQINPSWLFLKRIVQYFTNISFSYYHFVSPYKPYSGRGYLISLPPLECGERWLAASILHSVGVRSRVKRFKARILSIIIFRSKYTSLRHPTSSRFIRLKKVLITHWKKPALCMSFALCRCAVHYYFNWLYI